MCSVQAVLLAHLLPENREITVFVIGEDTFNDVCRIILIWCLYNFLNVCLFKCSSRFVFPSLAVIFLSQSKMNLYLFCSPYVITYVITSHSHSSPRFFLTSHPLSVELCSLSCEFCFSCLCVHSHVPVSQIVLLWNRYSCVLTHLPCFKWSCLFSVWYRCILMLLECTLCADTKGIKVLRTLAC